MRLIINHESPNRRLNQTPDVMHFLPKPLAAFVRWNVHQFVLLSDNYRPKQKDSGLNFLKDTNIIQNLVWSICSGMMVANKFEFCEPPRL
ncbi:MAG: hypothetical protein R6V52_09570 [Bacteroidales bacterium]